MYRRQLFPELLDDGMSITPITNTVATQVDLIDLNRCDLVRPSMSTASTQTELRHSCAEPTGNVRRLTRSDTPCYGYVEYSQLISNPECPAGCQILQMMVSVARLRGSGWIRPCLRSVYYTEEEAEVRCKLL